MITSVDRDDLPDYGSGVWAALVRQIRKQAPDCKIELLTPDFRGEEMPLARVIAERPDVLQPQRRGRPAALPGGPTRLAVERSLRVLSNAREMGGARSSRSPA